MAVDPLVPTVIPHPRLGAALGCLGALVIVYAVLGTLILDVIHFRTPDSGLNQIRGGDLAALVVVAPACFVLAWLAR